MSQFLVIIRGAPASGKTTIAKKLRNFDQRVAWLKVDNFKDFFSEDPSLDHQQFVDECALASLRYLLDKGFSVVMEKIFYDPTIIPQAVALAADRNIPVKIFQLTAPLATLQARDKVRPGVKEGCRQPLGDDVIEKIYHQLNETFLSEAIKLDTEQYSLVDECVANIRQEL